MAKHLIDTDLYIDLIQSGVTLPLIRELYYKDAPGIYFSSVVAQELLAGASSAAARRRVQTLYRPFEKVGRVVTPNHNQWKDVGRDFGQGSARPAESQKQAAGLGQ